MLYYQSKYEKKPGAGPKKKTEKVCLSCGKTFKSEGPFNRMCHSCKERGW